MGNCPTCGARLSDDTAYCPSCGKRVESEAAQTRKESSSALETNTVPPVTKKKGTRTNKKLFIIIPLALLLLGAAGAAAVFFNMSPKELYLYSEYNSYKKMTEEFENKYGDSFELQKRMVEKQSSSEMTVSGNLEMDSMASNPDVEMMSEILRASSITMKVDQDPENKANKYKLALNMNEEDVLDMEFIQTEKQAAIKVPALYEKFFYLNFDEYGALMRKMDPMYSGPEKLEFSQAELKELYLSEKEQNYLKEKYSKFLVEELDENSFTVKKNVEYEHEGEKMKLREVTLTLSEKETKALIDSFLDQLIADKKLHNMIVDRVVEVAKAGAMTEEVNAEIQDPAKLKQELVDGLEQQKEALKDVEFPRGVKSVLLVDKEEQVIDRELTFAVEGKQEPINLALQTKNVPYKDNKRWQEVLIEVDGGKSETMTIFSKNGITEGKKNRKEDWSVGYFLENNGEKADSVDLKLVSDFKTAGENKQVIGRDFTVSTNSSAGVPSELSGTIKQENMIDLKKNLSEQTVDIAIDFEDASEKGTVSLKVDNKTEVTEKAAAIKNVAGDNVNVSAVTDQEIALIYQEISMNLMPLMQKLGLMDGSMFGGMGGAPLPSNPEDPLTMDPDAGMEEDPLLHNPKQGPSDEPELTEEESVF